MVSVLKLSQKGHSGRLRPHEHTSYIPLIALVVLVGTLFVKMSMSAIVLADHPGAQAGSVGLTGIMPAKPPQEGATITSPTDQTHFTTSPITVSGTCPTSTLVEVYKNNIFGGSTPCDDGGKYSVQIDLLYGKNSLTAQVYDVLNQAGPVSNSVTVYYDVTPPISPGLTFLNFGASQLLLETDAVYRGSFPGQAMNVPVSIIGGASPFALNISWGDSNTKIVPRGDNTVYNANHTYQKPGTYKLTFQATDSQNQVAFLTVAVIVNGQPTTVSSPTTTTPKKTLNKLLVLWPLYAIILTLVISFWLGERREKKIMEKFYATQLNPSLGVTTHVTA